MKKIDKMAILGLLVGLLIITIIFFARRYENNNERSYQLSKNAQVVRDYLSGKEISGEDAWWLCLDGNEFNSGINKMPFEVSSELKMEYSYFLRQIRPNKFSIVYRPEKK